jgi:CzcA family heavy metal efflux pump
MIRWLVRSSITFRLIVLAGAVVLMVVGVLQLRDAQSDVLPEFAPPYVEVQTEALGLSAAEVESLVSLNVEELLAATPWVESIESSSVPGLSSVVLTFEPGTDVLRARQIVAERLALAYALPNVSQPPQILQPLSASSRVMMVGLSSREISPIDISVLTRWTIRPALLAVPGVANVAIWGYKDRQLQVQVDPKRLAGDKISLDQIVRTAGNAMWVSPLSYLEASTPGTGGWIDTPQQRLEVRHLFPIQGPEDLARVRVEDRSERLGAVTEVVEGHPPLIGDSVLRDGPGVLLVVEKFPGADTLQVTRDVQEVLDDLRPGLTGITVDSNVFRPSRYIVDAVDNLTLVLIVGGVLGLLALLALLYDWRAALVSAVAIAVAMTAAALVVHLLGHTINAMVLAGLAIALVIVIDEAIVGVENVMRRLREARAAGDERPATQIVFDGTVEVQRLVVYGALIAVLPLLPVLFMTGVSGELLEPLAIAYALAVGVAILLALTLTPALTAMLLSRWGGPSRESPVARRLQAAYGSALDRATRRPGLALAAAALLLVAGVAAAPFLGRTQLPEFEDRNLVVRWDGAPGTSEPEMTRITERLARELRLTPGVENATGQVGRAILGDQIGDVNAAEVYVRVAPDADYAATRAAVERAAAGYPGMSSAVETYERVSVRRAETGSDDPVTVTVFGPRHDVLRAKAEEIGGVVADVDGVRAVEVEREVLQPHVQIEVDLARAQRYGLKPGDVRREVATLLAGLEVGSLFEEQKIFQVAVWTEPDTRHSLSDIESLPIGTPDGGTVPLGAVADVALTSSQAVIKHDAISRRVEIGLTLDGRDSGAVMDDIRDRLQEVEFPLEYHAEVRGEPSAESDARTLMIGAGVAAGIAVFLLLQAAFGSWRLAGLMFLALPAGLAGGVAAVAMAGDDVSLASLVAFAALLAVAARNGILLFARYRRLEDDEGVSFGRELVVRGARDRVVPVVLTALATVLALLPLLTTGSRAGQELAHPIAVILLGGLVTTTALSLFVMPALYLRFGHRRLAARGREPGPETVNATGGS